MLPINFGYCYFLFFQKDWSRKKDQSPEMNFLSPLEDINSPDLYIPTMAFVSYVLLIGLFMGTRLVFTPVVIGNTISTALIIISLEVLLVKIAVWLLGLELVLGLLDIVAFSGYKFVGSVINLIIGLFAGQEIFYGAYFINSLLFSIFLGRSLKAAIQNTSMQDSSTHERTRNYLLFAWVFLQFLLIYFLCNKGF